MGRDFADTAPFLYFTSHGDPILAHAVTEGRLREHADFAGTGDFFDPQAPETFEKSKLNWALLGDPVHAGMLRFYRQLIALRKRLAALHNGRKDLTRVEVCEEEQWLKLERADPSGARAILLSTSVRPSAASPCPIRSLPGD